MGYSNEPLIFTNALQIKYDYKFTHTFLGRFYFY